jgi:hypothetical protein
MMCVQYVPIPNSSKSLFFGLQRRTNAFFCNRPHFFSSFTCCAAGLMRVLVVDAFLPTKRGREASAVFVDRVRAVLNPLDVQVCV